MSPLSAISEFIYCRSVCSIHSSHEYVLSFASHSWIFGQHTRYTPFIQIIFLEIRVRLFFIETGIWNAHMRYEDCIPTVNCMWFSSDLMVIGLLPFNWSPGHSQYTVDANEHVTALSIVREKTVPLMTYCLKNLKLLQINETDMDRLPQEIKMLSNLVHLNLDNNQNLSDVADEIGELVNLKQLRISGSNKLTHLPAAIGKLRSLIDLSITFASLEDIPISIGKLNNLETVDFSGNRLVGLPFNLKTLTSVRSLKLNNNPFIASLREAIELPNLRQLYLVGCSMKEFPLDLTNMTMLESIDLGANELTSIHYNIAKLTNLRSLYMGGNRFTSVPRELLLVRNLTTLNMDGNNLIDISALSSLKQISYVYLNRNQIPYLPSDIRKLNQTLTYLNLNDNKLTGLPKELAQMSQLKTLYIKSNTFNSSTIESIRDMFLDNTWTKVYY